MEKAEEKLKWLSGLLGFTYVSDYVFDEVNFIENDEGEKVKVKDHMKAQVGRTRQMKQLPDETVYDLYLCATNRGFGVKAGKYIPPNTPIAAYVGKVSYFEFVNEESEYVFRTSSNCYVDSEKIGNLTRYFNSSCQPNTESRMKWFNDKEYAVLHSGYRGVCKDEEITIDYFLDIHYGSKNGVCKCGAPNCRKIFAVVLEKDLNKCRICGFEAPTRQNLYNHRIVQHIFNGELKCEFENCESIPFNDYSNFCRHWRKVHPWKEEIFRKRFVCNKYNKDLCSPNLFLDHNC